MEPYSLHVEEDGQGDGKGRVNWASEPRGATGVVKSLGTDGGMDVTYCDA